MKIQNIVPQLNQFDLNVTQHQEPSLQSTVRNLAQKSNIPTPLALTHQFTNARLDHLDKEIQQRFQSLNNQLESSSSNPEAALSAGSRAINTATIVHTCLTVQQINTEKQALTHLKRANFQPQNKSALIVPLSGQALGGMPRGGYASNRATLQQLNRQLGELRTQKNDLKEQIKFWTNQQDEMLDQADMYARQENPRRENACRNAAARHTATVNDLVEQKAGIKDSINRVRQAIDNMTDD